MDRSPPKGGKRIAWGNGGTTAAPGNCGEKGAARKGAGESGSKEGRIFRWMLRTARTPPGPYIFVGSSQGRGRSFLALGSPRPPLRGEKTTFETAVSILCFRLQTEF